MKLVYEHIQCLFGRNLDYEVTHYRSCKNESFLPTYIKPTRALVYLTDPIELEKLIDWLPSAPELKHLEVQDFSSKEPLKSKKFNSGIWSNFQGEYLILENVKFSEHDIIDFLNEWKAGKGSQNLKRVDISLRRKVCLDPLRISNGIGLKTLRRVFIPYFDQEHERRTNSPFKRIDLFTEYIVRDTDRAVATVYLLTNRIEICFLEKNELEMKRMGFINR
ncbi:hypothetical protein GCK72_000757 [Caenorhabditis remanei]|uniref:F-box associated domain-containing protein n=1 Tax=Caenorhabditis remanei TaxID=31234 RepID=A0A6A5HQQ3_CAERE|nr:hypothetical protein GCK72_000757 [Caenorhabditis remanei]KAF1768944.1 hypothetical protein GCK72_000757 [Caenorhabditis remanei]